MMSNGRFLAITVLTFCVLLIDLTTAYAHGGGRIQIAKTPLCGDLISVWLNPSPPKTNERLHFTVGIADANDATPVLDKQVMIELLESQQLVQAAAATTEQSVNRLFYEADFSPLPAGNYEVRTVIRCEQAEEVATFMVEVAPLSPLSRFLPYITAVFFIAAALFVWKRSQTSKTQVNRPVRS